MKKGILIATALACFCTTVALAADPKQDIFKGKLFPPNVILENQAALELDKEQFTAIRAAVVEVQANVAEHEWDMREAYVGMMAELDKSPINEAKVIDYVEAALKAENQVKKQQMLMLIKLRKLLTDEQVAYLKSVQGE